MSTRHERQLARAIAAHGYDGSSFSGSRILRFATKSRGQVRESFLLVIDEDRPALEVISGLSLPHAVFLDEQDFEVASEVGPIIVYQRVSPQRNGQPDRMGEMISEAGARSNSTRYGPFSHEAQIQIPGGLSLFGFRGDVIREDGVLEVIGLTLAKDPVDALSEATLFLEARSDRSHERQHATEIFDTGWARPKRLLVVFQGALERPVSGR